MTSVASLFQGQALRCSLLEGDIAELTFDLKDDSVNKLGAITLRELRESMDKLKAQANLKGLLISSAKDCFIVGADITEFLASFKWPEPQFVDWLMGVNRIFNDIEDLNCPSVVAINGFALGGGFELALSAAYRVMAAQTKVGLPETKLGIYPGWGGTVRLSRLIGADNALEWIATGDQWGADAALKVGAVDAVVTQDSVRDASLRLLKDAIDGRFDWRARQAQKKSPLKLNTIESTMAFEGGKAFIAGKAGPNYPAPVAAVEAMREGAKLTRDEALPFEAAGFAKVARTQTAASLVSIFLGDQYVKKTSKKIAKGARPVKGAAVLGAGIMGGGIAYQSASKGTPIIMKDIRPEALQLGMTEASKLLSKQVERGKLDMMKMAQTVASIKPTLNFGDFAHADIVVEAVVENEKVKRGALAEVEGIVKPGTIIASNTSTISITKLAESLKHPENFCGMHFFNPVHRMPLVEIIRGKKTSDEAIATTVAYALAMGKTPIVVNDCAGFLVNRVLFPYFAGFSKLIADGVDFQRIDKVMEKFGWPMGPAYLLDVVGIDTGHHADAVMAQAFPDRMAPSGKTAIDAMYEAKRFGQKNGVGFYRYSEDKKGKPKKEVDPAAYEILAPIMGRKQAEDRQDGGTGSITDQEIIDRMMLPMIIECSRCLEDRIVATPIENDIALVYGLGFPPFRGGALRYADTVGLKALCETAEKYKPLGKLYEPTAQMRKLAEAGKTFYGN